MDYFTRDNITLVLAIIGTLGTMGSAFFAVISNRKKLVLSVLGYRYDPAIYTFYIMLENKSRLPISINQISIIKGGQSCRCLLIPKVAIEVTKIRGEEILKRREYSSEQFPINIPGLTSHSGFLLFEPYEQILTSDATSVSFEVCTNRGKAKKIELLLSDAFDPFQILL